MTTVLVLVGVVRDADVECVSRFPECARPEGSEANASSGGSTRTRLSPTLMKPTTRPDMGKSGWERAPFDGARQCRVLFWAARNRRRIHPGGIVARSLQRADQKRLVNTCHEDVGYGALEVLEDLKALREGSERRDPVTIRSVTRHARTCQARDRSRGTAHSRVSEAPDVRLNGRPARGSSRSTNY